MACFKCNTNATSKLFGYDVCDTCKSELRLFSSDTIKKHTVRFQKTEDISYQTEISNKLKKVELTYIKAKIKLLDIQEKLNTLL